MDEVFGVLDFGGLYAVLVFMADFFVGELVLAFFSAFSGVIFDAGFCAFGVDFVNVFLEFDLLFFGEVDLGDLVCTRSSWTRV